MVLKVVTAKIFKTLELEMAWLPGVPFGNHGQIWTMVLPWPRLLGAAHWERPDARNTVRLSKILDYLADNPHVFMLSEVKALGQEESGRAAEPVPDWEFAPTLSAKDAETGWAPASSVDWSYIEWSQFPQPLPC